MAYPSSQAVKQVAPTLSAGLMFESSSALAKAVLVNSAVGLI